MRCWAERIALAALAAALVSGCVETPQTPTVGHSAPPRAVRTPPPDYPEALACEGIGGRVDLRVTITPQGGVGDVRVQRSSRNAQLDQAAVAAVRGWEFAPATRGGTPVSSTISVPMSFRVPAERPERCFLLDEQR